MREAMVSRNSAFFAPDNRPNSRLASAARATARFTSSAVAEWKDGSIFWPVAGAKAWNAPFSGAPALPALPSRKPIRDFPRNSILQILYLAACARVELAFLG